MTNVRDEVETVLRAWDAHEVRRGGNPVIDFDLFPGGPEVEAAADRLEVYRRLHELRPDAEGSVAERIDADLAYLAALLGEHRPLDEYVRATQGCGAVGWSEEYAEERRQVTVAALDEVGVGWGPETNTDLRLVEGLLDVADAPDAIREAVAELEPVIRKVTGSEAPYRLSIETADVDAYWAYWLDGAGQDVRLRLNLPNVEFTKAGARQFALHEVLGHGLQSASLHEHAADAPWVRLLSVHALHQVTLEGLAQAWPLFLVPDDKALIARIRLDHYVQLARAEAHLALDAGAPMLEIADRLRRRVPWWDEPRVAGQLTDRGADPMLRSYLWAYPAGVDWFVSLAERGGQTATEKVLRTSYREPLTPAALSVLWPEGPVIGG